MPKLSTCCKEGKYRKLFWVTEAEWVKSFRYLGRGGDRYKCCFGEDQSRIASGHRSFYALSHILRARAVSRKTKIYIYKTIIRSVVIYGSETSSLTAGDEELSR